MTMEAMTKKIGRGCFLVNRGYQFSHAWNHETRPNKPTVYALQDSRHAIGLLLGLHVVHL